METEEQVFSIKNWWEPVFLDLQYIPSYNDLKCSKCDKTLTFLLQIYAPIETRVDAFHRTLFVFCCRNDCNELKVLRSQLHRINSYYSSDPPNYDLDDESYDPKPEHFGHQLCVVCGLDAKNKCSKCLEVNYCSKDHQIIDWKEGKHKSKCGKTNDLSESNHLSALFPEYELIIGDNESDVTKSDDENDDNNGSDLERNEMQKFNELIEKSCPKYQAQDFSQYEEENNTEEQKLFDRFKRLSSGEQVIRYCSYDEGVDAEQEPLWICSKNKPNLPIPNCQYCDSKRRFEFQIMPQLLNKILRADDKLDWGLLVVYTCAQSCSSNVAYKQEFIWKQTIE